MSIESVMPSNHLILCRSLCLPPLIFPSIRVFSNESVLCIRLPEYWSFSFSISPYNKYSGLISFRMDWSQSKGLSRVFPTPLFKSVSCQQLHYANAKRDWQVEAGTLSCSSLSPVAFLPWNNLPSMILVLIQVMVLVVERA